MERSLFGLTAMVLAAVLCGCGGMQGSGGAPGGFPGVSPGFSQTTSSGSPIQHIVIMVQEARGFNAIFGTTKIAKARAGKGKHAHIITIRLRKVGFNAKGPSKTLYDAYLRDLGNGKMDGFYEENGRVAYEYLDPAVIRPYSAISSDYAVADHMFETQGSGDFTAHQDLIRGGTEVSSKASVIDIPRPSCRGDATRLRVRRRVSSRPAGGTRRTTARSHALPTIRCRRGSIENRSHGNITRRRRVPVPAYFGTPSLRSRRWPITSASGTRTSRHRRPTY